MASGSPRVDYILANYGKTYAEEATIKLTNKPAPLYQLLVLATLLAARINAEIALAAARELFKAGYRTAQHMADATWQQRVDALGRGHYRRYDESTATVLGDSAHLLQDRYQGDLRKLRQEAQEGKKLSDLLQEFPGIGPVGADIFIREVQGIWTDYAPYLDKKTKDGARLLGLSTSHKKWDDLVSPAAAVRLAAACVRATLDEDIGKAIAKEFNES